MSEALDRVRAAAGRLKVFPLPSVVLLPGTVQRKKKFKPGNRRAG